MESVQVPDRSGSFSKRVLDITRHFFMPASAVMFDELNQQNPPPDLQHTLRGRQIAAGLCDLVVDALPVSALVLAITNVDPVALATAVVSTPITRFVGKEAGRFFFSIIPKSGTEP